MNPPNSPEIQTGSATPCTDAEEARQRSLYNKWRECGWPAFAADFDFARRMERLLREILDRDLSSIREIQQIALHYESPEELRNLHRRIEECLATNAPGPTTPEDGQ